MAVDTAAKRFAILTFGTLIANLIVVDGVVSTEDRISALGLYNGFALDPPVEGGDAYGWYSPYRRRRMNNQKIVRVRNW